jgi:glycosyltransferase involved in cell wall biosynthesis
LLAKIADLTMKMNSSVQFLIVGPGDPKKFGLDGQPNVICTGSLAHREVLAIFPQCDLFVFPTRHEGRGIVFLEAMASGLPCVTTALSVITEILTEETGIVVQVEDVKTFAEKICALSSDPMKRKIMGEKAKHRIKELSLDWNTSAANYLWIFQKLTLRA